MSKITFKSLAIQNLGPFAERQVIDLSVKSGKPIILFKALNGSGKTTLLTCLQVVLYGSKAIGTGRTVEYEQLIKGLLRNDAVDTARIEIELIVDSHGDRDVILVSREWQMVGAKLNEKLNVTRGGTQDFSLTQEWDEYIDSILPSELVQLFLFDGEKIESLANPKTLPEMLRRATEAFLGIGGIDSLIKDLLAVERRAVMRVKDHSSEYSAAQAEVVELESSFASISNQITVLTQNVASLLIDVDKSKNNYQNFAAKAKRAGLEAFENAAELKVNEEIAIQKVKSAADAVRESLSDPLLPLNGCSSLWKAYKNSWIEESETKVAKNILNEIEARDKRILNSLKANIDKETLKDIEQTFVKDNSSYRVKSNRNLVLIEADPPEFLEQNLANAAKKYETSLNLLTQARAELTSCQRKLAAVPQGDRLSELLQTMQQLSSDLASAESAYADARKQLDELIGKREHLEAKLSAASFRLGKDFRGLAHHEKSLAAGQRAREVLLIYKDRLLASKAAWLSEMITFEFKGLMRKQLLIKQVLVDPESYSVSIVGSLGQILPMERLSAGERQLLAVSVLSALIRERKGRFPVVVDTPLARLDRTHREALIKRFFAKISHQVVVLSTDEEVHGTVLVEMEKFTSNSYQIDFSDKLMCSKFGPLMHKFNEATA